VLSGLLLLICAAMVIAFIPGNLGNDLTVRPARALSPKVDGEDITADEVRETARGMLQQQGAQLGANASICCLFLRNAPPTSWSTGRHWSPRPSTWVESHPQEIQG